MTSAKQRHRALSWLPLVLFAATAAALASACSGTDTQPTPSNTCTPDLASIQETVFARSCSQQGCHASVEPAAFLDLASPGLEKRLVGTPSGTCENKALVVPGNPAQSFLVEKVKQEMPTCGLRMPPAGGLPAEEVSCIESWIADLPDGGSDAGSDAPSCETCASASCVDLQTDPSHCGACGKVCPSGAACAAGACACSESLTACDETCVDTTSDPMNCGTCGNACDVGKVCNGSACNDTCGMLEACGASCVDTSTSVTNCGACGNVCAAGTTCLGGACACPDGGVSCSGKCVDPQTDTNNCGACGNVCAAGQTCAGGACTCGNGSVSFAADVQPIFTASCAAAGCHKGVASQAGLDLSVGNSFAELVNVATSQCNDGRKRVLPGDPAQSYLIDKMMNVDLCSGTQMPKTGQLPSAQISTVANWICAGAPNN